MQGCSRVGSRTAGEEDALVHHLRVSPHVWLSISSAAGKEELLRAHGWVVCSVVGPTTAWTTWRCRY